MIGHRAMAPLAIPEQCVRVQQSQCYEESFCDILVAVWREVVGKLFFFLRVSSWKPLLVSLACCGENVRQWSAVWSAAAMMR